MAQRLGLYVAVNAAGDSVSAGPDLDTLINIGWKYLNTVNMTYAQLENPPSGPGSTAVTVWVFEDATAEDQAEGDGVTLGLEGIFGATAAL